MSLQQVVNFNKKKVATLKLLGDCVAEYTEESVVAEAWLQIDFGRDSDIPITRSLAILLAKFFDIPEKERELRVHPISISPRSQSVIINILMEPRIRNQRSYVNSVARKLGQLLNSSIDKSGNVKTESIT